MPTPPRTPKRVVVRDAAKLAEAVEASGMSLRRLSAATTALRLYRPEVYDTASHTLIGSLMRGTTPHTSVMRAQAIEEALRVTPGTFFDWELVNDQSVSA